MFLYEYELLENKITKSIYEIKETPKSYIVLERKYISYNGYSRIPKDVVGKVFPYWKHIFYYSLNDDMEEARQAFLTYLENVKIPECEKELKKIQDEKEKYKDMFDRLKKKK